MTAKPPMCKPAASPQPGKQTLMRILLLVFAILVGSATNSTADCNSDVKTAFEKLRKSAAFRMDTKINEQGP